MPMLEVASLLVAAVFAFFNGVNDGGSLLATSLRLSGMRLGTAVLLLSTVVAAAPVVLGTRVATTLTQRLVGFEGIEGQVAFLVAVTGASGVVWVLSRRGLPTSLTLALIGGIVGVALGSGLEVLWPWVILVLALAAVAPAAGLVVAVIVARLWAALPIGGTVGDQVRYGQRLAVVFQAFAYGSNDGQKMLAVFMVAGIGVGVGGSLGVAWWVLAVIGVLFALGTGVGMRRHGRTLGSSIAPLSPVEAVNAQFSAAATVIATASGGFPVSMTQSIAGGLIGSSYANQRLGRVRWDEAARIAVAWVVTLPAAAVLAAVLGLFLSVVSGGRW